MLNCGPDLYYLSIIGQRIHLMKFCNKIRNTIKSLNSECDPDSEIKRVNCRRFYQPFSRESFMNGIICFSLLISVVPCILM